MLGLMPAANQTLCLVSRPVDQLLGLIPRVDWPMLGLYSAYSMELSPGIANAVSSSAGPNNRHKIPIFLLLVNNFTLHRLHETF